MPLPAAAAAAAAGAVAVVYRGVDGVPLPALWPLVLLLAALLLVTPMFIARDPHRLPLAARARRDEDHEFDGELAVEQAPSALAQEVGDRLFGEGEALEHGDSGPADMAAAAHKYVEAAGMGHPASLAKTGLFRMQGLGGLPRDEAEGVRLLRRAAALGDCVAQCNLAAACLHGLGGPVDHAAAVRWYQRAAANGFPAAQYNLGLMYAEGIFGLARNDEEAAAFLAPAARAGYGPAQYHLGVLMEEGRGGLRRDPAQAMRLYSAAAAQAFQPALARLRRG